MINEFTEKLQDFEVSEIVTLDTTTTVKLTGGKKNPMAGRVKKITTDAQVMLFKNGEGYKNLVNERLKEQHSEDTTTSDLFEAITAQEFTPGPRQWGQRVQDTPFITHKDKLYLECIFVKSGESTYYLDDVEIDKGEIIGLPEKKESSQNGLVNKVIIRTFALDSIIRVNKSGEIISGLAIS